MDYIDRDLPSAAIRWEMEEKRRFIDERLFILNIIEHVYNSLGTPVPQALYSTTRLPSLRSRHLTSPILAAVELIMQSQADIFGPEYCGELLVSYYINRLNKSFNEREFIEYIALQIRYSLCDLSTCPNALLRRYADMMTTVKNAKDKKGNYFYMIREKLNSAAKEVNSTGRANYKKYLRSVAKHLRNWTNEVWSSVTRSGRNPNRATQVLKDVLKAEVEIFEPSVVEPKSQTFPNAAPQNPLSAELSTLGEPATIASKETKTTATGAQDKSPDSECFVPGNRLSSEPSTSGEPANEALIETEITVSDKQNVCPASGSFAPGPHLSSEPSILGEPTNEALIETETTASDEQDEFPALSNVAPENLLSLKPSISREPVTPPLMETKSTASSSLFCDTGTLN